MLISEFRKLDEYEKWKIVVKELLDWNAVVYKTPETNQEFKVYVPLNTEDLITKNPDMAYYHYQDFAFNAEQYNYLSNISAALSLIPQRRDLKTTFSIRSFDSVVIISSWIDNPQRGRAYTSFSYKSQAQMAEELCICMLVADGFLIEDEF